MKILMRVLICALLMMGTSSLVWTMLPHNRIEKVFIIDPEYSLFSKKKKCEEVNNLLRANYKVTYPRSIWSGKSGFVQVDIEKGQINENNNDKDDELDPCEISLEVWIDGEGMIAEPGTKIINPLLNVASQPIKFKIFPATDQPMSGTIWINAVYPGDTGSVLERIPIFAMPFSIQVHSPIGMSARIFRILSIFMIILALALGFFRKASERKPK